MWRLGRKPTRFAIYQEAYKKIGVLSPVQAVCLVAGLVVAIPVITALGVGIYSLLTQVRQGVRDAASGRRGATWRICDDESVPIVYPLH